MIPGFENYTHELTEYEETEILPKVVKQMKLKIGKETAVTNSHVVKAFKKHGYKLTEPRFRKIIQHIRITGMIENLVSSGNGYYVATDPKEVKKYIESLDKRINAITLMRDQLMFQSKKLNQKIEDDPSD